MYLHVLLTYWWYNHFDIVYYLSSIKWVYVCSKCNFHMPYYKYYTTYILLSLVCIEYWYFYIILLHILVLCTTPHCNDDLNIINEQGNPMVNLSNLVLLQCKIAIFEIISPALLEILVGMHSPFCPIWRIFLPVYNRPSKRAGDLILKMAILHCQSTKLLDLTIGILCSFIMLRSSLQWGVMY